MRTCRVDVGSSKSMPEVLDGCSSQFLNPQLQLLAKLLTSGRQEALETRSMSRPHMGDSTGPAAQK